MLTTDNISLNTLRNALMGFDPNIDAAGRFLKFKVQDVACTVAIMPPNEVLLVGVTKAVLDRVSRLECLELVNNVNSDFDLAVRAGVDEGGVVTYSQLLSVSGGLTEENVFEVTRQFVLDCALCDAIFEKHQSR